MPWNEPGNNNSGKDPWGKGSSQPPDLDEVFSGLQKKLKGLFGGGKGGNGSSDSKSSGGGFGLGFILIAAAALWVIFDSPHVIDQAERGIVQTFGKYNRTLEPGLRFTWPRPIEKLTKVNVSEVQAVVSINDDRMLTSDENLIDIKFAVQYRIADGQAYLFKVRDPKEVLQLASESALREVVGGNAMDFILEEGRGQVASDTRALLQEIISRYNTGIEILSFNLQDVRPPMQVKDAFDDVVKAREDQERFKNEAQAYANKVVPEARGDAARITQEAEAYKTSLVALSVGEADRFSLQLNAYQAAPEVTRDRLYLQTMQEVLGNNHKVLLDVSSDGNIFYLPLDGQNSSSGQRPLPPLRSAGNNSLINQPQQPSTSNDSRNRGREGR